MARIYDVVCLNCGERYWWCKYDPPIEKCEFCGQRLSNGEEWNENAKVFGVWSSNEDVEKVAKEARARFFEKVSAMNELEDTVLDDRLGIKALLVCRNCDLPMLYEGENPKNYLLYRCQSCGNRVGILYEKV